MVRVPANQLGISQGTVMMFSDFVDDGPMWIGNGPRSARVAVRFDDAFIAPPVVHVSITMWDADNASNQRMDLSADKVTPEGFDLVFKTWGDSRVARVRASWTAFGALGQDEDWELY